jgi:hypothetical protein
MLSEFLEEYYYSQNKNSIFNDNEKCIKTDKHSITN